MRRVIVLGSVLALVILGSVYWTGRTEPMSHDSSPAFQSMLSQAIARLEGVTQQITAAGGGVAVAQGKQDTFDPSPTCGLTMAGQYTCINGGTTCFGGLTCDGANPDCFWTMYDHVTCQPTMPTCDDSHTCTGDYTCDSRVTCFGGTTCNGTLTCWMSTCEQQNMTCDGISETCFDCTQFTYQGGYTCDGSTTCYNTCSRWPTCSVPQDPDCCDPSAAGRTTWGQLKKEFNE